MTFDQLDSSGLSTGSGDSAYIFIFAGLLATALAGCGGSDPAAQSGAMTRSAASVVSAPLTIADYKPLVVHIYVAYFGRPAELAGLDFWANVLSQRGAAADLTGTLISLGSDGRSYPVIDAFATSQEWNARYPGANHEFIDRLYRNLFNHPADIAGLAYWTDALNSGAMTRQVAALMLMAGAQGDDALAVNNKVAVARRFDELYAARIAADQYLQPNFPIEQTRALIGAVDARTDLAAYDSVIKALVDRIIEGCLDPIVTGSGAAPSSQTPTPCPV